MRAITSSLLLIVLAATYTETRADTLAHFVKIGHITKQLNIDNFRAAGSGSGDGGHRAGDKATVVAEMKKNSRLVINLKDPDDDDLHYAEHYVSVGASVLASRSAGFCEGTSTKCDTVGATGGACAADVTCEPLISVEITNTNTGGITNGTQCNVKDEDADYKSLWTTLVGDSDGDDPPGELLCNSVADDAKLATCYAQYSVMTAGPYLRPTTLCQAKFGAYDHRRHQKTVVTVTAHANLVGTIGVGIGINTPPTYLKDMADYYNPGNQLDSGEYLEMFSRYNLEDRDDYENMHEFGYIGITWALLFLVWNVATWFPAGFDFKNKKMGSLALVAPFMYPKGGNHNDPVFSTDPHKWIAMGSFHALTSPIMYFAVILRHAHEAPEAAIAEGKQAQAMWWHVILPVLLIAYLQFASGSPVVGYFDKTIRNEENQATYMKWSRIFATTVAILYVVFSPFLQQQFVYISYGLMCGAVLLYFVNMAKSHGDDGYLKRGASGWVNGDYVGRTSTKPQYSSVVTDISSGGAPVLGGQVRYKDSLA